MSSTASVVADVDVAVDFPLIHLGYAWIAEVEKVIPQHAGGL